MWEIVSCSFGLNTGGDSPQRVKHWETISITVAIYVKEIDFALLLASCILSLTLHLNPTFFSRQEVFLVICQW